MPKMPADNIMDGSAALQTHGVWQNTIGYDPYAPKNQSADVASGPAQNPYDNFQGLLAMARLTGGSSAANVKGSCRKCGGAGHLTFQCRNYLKANQPTIDDVSSTSSDESDESDIYLIYFKYINKNK
eukprot:Phypoly_transcript_13474.p1 GENE.Phypoly_transcript_13474~~Phypoly_transcript_13474.p1  ORF type:complete len:127 (+),score=18.84 Phypoly_transcript_13474:41-421(+)